MSSKLPLNTLPPPYDLIAMLGQYVSVRSLLALPGDAASGAYARCNHPVPGSAKRPAYETITMRWSRFRYIGRDITFPYAAWNKYLQYRHKHMSPNGWRWGGLRALFVIDARPVRYADWERILLINNAAHREES